MIRRFSKIALSAALMAVLAACQTEPTAQRLPDITFVAKRPIMLDVGQLEIVQEYVSPARRPNVEHLMAISPEAATIRWVKDRLKPVGRTGSARVVIKDAHVVETQLRVDKSFAGNFKDQQSERYDGALDVTVQILDERHMPLAEVVARATHAKTVVESATLNDREKTLYTITESLIRDIDSQLEGLIPNYMARWIQ